jgi:ribosomal-protein-alanine acetyltransferase
MLPHRFHRTIDAGAAAAIRRIAGSAGLTPPTLYQILALRRQPATRVRLLEVPVIARHPVGFVLLQVIPPEAEILDIAVMPEAGRRGFGSCLLRAALAELPAAGVTACFLEVRAANAPAVAFYTRHGFTLVRVRRGYYAEPPDDALCLSRRLPGPSAGVFLS